MNSCDISQRQCTQFSILSANKRQPSHQSETDASQDYCYRSSAPLLLRLPSICVTSIKTVSVLLLVALQKMYFARSLSLRTRAAQCQTDTQAKNCTTLCWCYCRFWAPEQHFSQLQKRGCQMSWAHCFLVRQAYDGMSGDITHNLMTAAARKHQCWNKDVLKTETATTLFVMFIRQNYICNRKPVPVCWNAENSSYLMFRSAKTLTKDGLTF